MPDFEISRIAVGPGRRYRRSSRGPEILLCASGAASISCEGEPGPTLGRGESAFVAADACDYEIEAAPAAAAIAAPGAPQEAALVFRASVPAIP